MPNSTSSQGRNRKLLQVSLRLNPPRVPISALIRHYVMFKQKRWICTHLKVFKQACSTIKSWVQLRQWVVIAFGQSRSVSKVVAVIRKFSGKGISQKEIIAATGLSERAVKYALKRLLVIQVISEQAVIEDLRRKLYEMEGWKMGTNDGSLDYIVRQNVNCLWRFVNKRNGS